MADCCNPAGYQKFFDDQGARRSLRRYDKKGLDPLVRRMVDFMKRAGIEERSVVEAGGGIGAIQVELLAAGAGPVTNVELSGGYESVAAELLEREGLTGRVERILGDFTEVATDLEGDFVVLNRVICCYPYMERLLSRALDSSRRFVAVTFPRGHVVSRAAISVENLYHRLRGVEFRGYAHPPDEIIAVAASRGFEVIYRDDDLMWQAVVFERAA